MTSFEVKSQDEMLTKSNHFQVHCNTHSYQVTSISDQQCFSHFMNKHTDIQWVDRSKSNILLLPLCWRAGNKGTVSETTDKFLKYYKNNKNTKLQISTCFLESNTDSS